MGIGTGLASSGHLRRPAGGQTRHDAANWTETGPGLDHLLERETGIEPVSLAWKAKVLPLNYSRMASPSNLPAFSGGGGWIRTSVGVSQQIYSLPPLATRAPLLSEPSIMPDFSAF